MFTHQDIWIAIDELARAHGHSTSGLARLAGLDPTALNRSKRLSPGGKPRWPSTESIAKILTVTNSNMQEFLLLIEQQQPAERSDHLAAIACNGLFQEQDFDLTGTPAGPNWTAVRLTDFQLQTPQDHYVIQINTQDFEPVYQKNAVLLIRQNAQLQERDHILCHVKGYGIHVTRILHISKNHVVLHALNEDQPVKVDTSDLQWANKITWASQ